MSFWRMTTNIGSSASFTSTRKTPSVFLPKRFGVGWTINFSRPAAWAVVIGFAAITAAFLVAVFTLVE